MVQVECLKCGDRLVGARHSAQVQRRSQTNSPNPKKPFDRRAYLRDIREHGEAAPDDLARVGKTKMLRELKNVPATRRPTNLTLTPRAQVVLGYLVYGIDEQDPNHPDIPTGRPLGPYQVADILSVRRSYVRRLIADPVFKMEMVRATADARAALQPKALHVLAENMDWIGDDKAADANIRANAAKTILGEDFKGSSVNVQMTTQTVSNFRPGYVIEYPPGFVPDAKDAPAIDMRPGEMKRS